MGNKKNNENVVQANFMIPEFTAEQNKGTEQNHNIILLLLVIIDMKIVVDCDEQCVLLCSSDETCIIVVIVGFMYFVYFCFRCFVFLVVLF